jgi:undecaprenyl-diphosphatase
LKNNTEKLPTENQPDEETRKAAEQIHRYLKDALEKIDTPEKSEAVVDELITEQSDRPADEVADEEVAVSEKATPSEQAEAAAETIKNAAEAEITDTQKAAETLKATAAELTELEGPAYEAVADEVQAVTDPALEGKPQVLPEQQQLLWEALKRHPSINKLEALDTQLFILINNHTPRTALTNQFFYQLSFWFNGGWAWLLGLLPILPFRPGWTVQTLRQIAPPIWVAALIVEGPIKKYFRRRRPFIDIVRAIVVGKKPGNWSFPSGHSAVGFAGALMLSRCLPRLSVLWYSLAGLVGFSRIYLGAHYPGDVISGAICGLSLAEISHKIFKKIFSSFFK